MYDGIFSQASSIQHNTNGNGTVNGGSLFKHATSDLKRQPSSPPTKLPTEQSIDMDRQVEMKCMEMKALMEEQGCSVEEVLRKVAIFRKMLMDKERVTQNSAQTPTYCCKPFISQRLQDQKENEPEINSKRSSSSPSPTRREKKKKKKRHHDRSESPVRKHKKKKERRKHKKSSSKEKKKKRTRSSSADSNQSSSTESDESSDDDRYHRSKKSSKRRGTSHSPSSKVKLSCTKSASPSQLKERLRELPAEVPSASPTARYKASPKNLTVHSASNSPTKQNGLVSSAKTSPKLTSKRSHSRSQSRSSYPNRRSRSRARSASYSRSRSHSRSSFSRSPSIRRRIGSPSHLDKRRITRTQYSSRSSGYCRYMCKKATNSILSSKSANITELIQPFSQPITIQD
ncbi:uncharacterized protein LOC141900009 isoform X3 [Tubulanus polymorphus]|uniref:uncharacterized protein LOC141900009 isoform X3 n=1 Tax=Tubulanus polymorphus TaxID=672921 RepID=UPI003DA2056F